eukprot:scaffold308879_cov36-Prasinocladus_malaysianus.AAC.1
MHERTSSRFSKHAEALKFINSASRSVFKREKVFSEEDVTSFLQISGDTNAIHTNITAAQAA